LGQTVGAGLSQVFFFGFFEAVLEILQVGKTIGLQPLSK